MGKKVTHISKERIRNSDGSLDSRAVQTSLDKLVENVNLLAGGTLGRVNLIKGVTITQGSTTIVKHGLGREVQGYIVILSSADINVYDLQTTNTRKATELWLSADTPVSASSTVNLLVF